MCSINWTKSRGHILFHKILSKRSPWALKDEEPCLFYCTDTPNSLGGMRLFSARLFKLRFNLNIDRTKLKIVHTIFRGSSIPNKFTARKIANWYYHD